jgi:hypothetical protein
VGRVCNRDADKRDLAAVSAVFTPLLDSIADACIADARSLAASDAWQFDREKAISAHLKSISERSKQWTPEDADNIAAQELLRSIRAMTYATHRSAGEHTADLKLEGTINA